LQFTSKLDAATAVRANHRLCAPGAPLVTKGNFPPGEFDWQTCQLLFAAARESDTSDTQTEKH
jgi:hypothetical protein